MLKLTQIEDVTRIDMTRTIGGRPSYWSTAYYVDGLLIDTGSAHTSGELLKALSGKPVTTVVNTHSHEDHIGANRLLQQAMAGVTLRAHPKALPILAIPRGQRRLQPYRLILFGHPAASRAVPVGDGEVIETPNHRFQVLHTPGHSPDHLCLYEPVRGWLFSGDLFIGGEDSGLRHTNDIWQIIASLKAIAALPAETLFPSSARIKHNPQGEILSKIEYLEQTGERVLTLRRKGWSTDAIARATFGKPRMVEWLTLGHFSRRHLVRSFTRPLPGRVH